MHKTLADTILTINNKYSYHMEAQITEEEDIIFRVFDYSFRHADRNRGENYRLIFPEPKIIYLCPSKKTPDEYSLTLDFGSQGTFTYKVSTFKFLETSVEELNNRKMIILIPFQLLKLKLKSLLAKNRSKENLALGNITAEDAQRLRRLTHRLYQHIYSHYDEMKEELNEMTDESLILDVDIVIEETTEKVTKELTEQLTAQFDKKLQEELAAKDAIIAEKEAALAKKSATEAENARLRAENEMLKQLQKK